LWNRAHPEIIEARTKEWTLLNPERRAQQKLRSARKHYAANPEYYALKMRKQQIKNPVLFQRNNMNYRLRKIRVGGTLSNGIWYKLFKNQNGICVYCKIDLSSVKTAIDHIQPISKGGTNTDDNVQLLCVSCNCRKGATYPYIYKELF
jgi:5-methylcytosine-specific restriction endonuclease McrA